MAMVIAMGIVESENTAVIAAKNGMVDICKVVAGEPMRKKRSGAKPSSIHHCAHVWGSDVRQSDECK
jgi:hypothetical protein